MSASHDDGVSSHRRPDCLINRLLIQAQIKKNIKAPRHCQGNPPVTNGFRLQKTSIADFFSFDVIIKVIRLGHARNGNWNFITLHKCSIYNEQNLATILNMFQ